MKKDVVAIIGAGKGGSMILETLLKMPDIEIRYVCDMNSAAPGIKLAKAHGITIRPSVSAVCADPELDLIFEATGSSAVHKEIEANKPKNSRVLRGEDSKIIYHLLDLQRVQTERLQEYNTLLEKSVMERTAELEKANRDLVKGIMEHEELNIKLQEINNEKTKYLLHATHQLKAPFAAIQSYIDIILGGYAGKLPAQLREIVLKISDRCTLLSNTIQEMLELANLKSLVIENIRFEPENLNTLISASIERFQDPAKAKNIQIRFEPSSKELTVNCNKNMIIILLSTLIENAISYSPANSEVVITTKYSPEDREMISIKDQGIGIEEKYLTQIFKEYFRTNEAVSVNSRGTGLGLAIAKEIAEIHNSNIQVESTRSKGSVFSFTLHKINAR